jgi:ribosomal protein L37AE/L43A
MSKVQRNRVNTLNCPQCGEKTLKKILYGMPSDNFDFQNSLVGGCIPNPEDIGCKNCEWVGRGLALDQLSPLITIQG